MYNYNVNKTSLASRARPSVSYCSAMSSNSNGKLFALITVTTLSLIGEQKPLLPHQAPFHHFGPFADPYMLGSSQQNVGLIPTSFHQPLSITFSQGTSGFWKVE